MKITFLVPPILEGNRATERVAGCTYSLYPVPNIYELAVVSYVRSKGHDVFYVESVFNKWTKGDFEKFLSKDNSDVYAIWTVNLGVKNDLKAMSIINELRPESKVVFQGPAPTQFPEQFLLNEFAFVLRGEPEETFVDLLSALSGDNEMSNILGLSYYLKGEKFDNSSRPLVGDLDNYPFPARDLITDFIKESSNPKLKKQPYTPMVTTRNCPGKCIYCVPSSLTFARELEYKKGNGGCKPPVAMRSVANVIKEIDLLAEQGYKAISFQDDNFLFGLKRLKPIAERLKFHNIVWGCQSRADFVTEDIVKVLVKNNCKYVDVGVESLDDNVLTFINKGITAEQTKNAIKLMKHYGLPTKINILVGAAPIETMDSIKKTISELKELKVDQIMLSITAPFPGTEYYDIAKEQGLFVNGDYSPVDVQKEAIISLPNLSKRQLERIVYWNNLKFFLNPRFVIKQVLLFRSFMDFKIAFIALWRKLFV